MQKETFNQGQNIELLYEIYYPVTGVDKIRVNIFVDTNTKELIDPLTYGSVVFFDVKGKFIPLRDFLDQKVEMQRFLEKEDEEYPFFDFYGVRINRLEVRKLIAFFDAIKHKAVALYNNYISSFYDIDNDDNDSFLPFAQSVYEFIEPDGYIKSVFSYQDNSDKSNKTEKTKLFFLKKE